MFISIQVVADENSSQLLNNGHRPLNDGYKTKKPVTVNII